MIPRYVRTLKTEIQFGTGCTVQILVRKYVVIQSDHNKILFYQ